jgi:hypothetical protein
VDTPGSTTSTTTKCSGFGKTVDGFLTWDGQAVIIDNALVKVTDGMSAGGPAAGFQDGNPQGVPGKAGDPEPGGQHVTLSNAPQDIASGLQGRMDALVAQGNPGVQKMATGDLPNDASGGDPRQAQIAKALTSEGPNGIYHAFELAGNSQGQLEDDIRSLCKAKMSELEIVAPPLYAAQG